LIKLSFVLYAYAIFFEEASNALARDDVVPHAAIALMLLLNQMSDPGGLAYRKLILLWLDRLVGLIRLGRFFTRLLFFLRDLGPLLRRGLKFG
jgi:hypothetical protein